MPETDGKLILYRLDKQDIILAEIKAQTTKTNGRVNSLENWLWLLKGAVGVIWLGVIPLVIYIYFLHK